METVPGPESTETKSPSLANLEAFKELFPGVIQDGVLDAARLGEAIGIEVAGLKDGKERFGLMWAGRQRAVEALQAPSYAALVPDIENSVNWDTAENVFIEGDNLEVLKLMQNAYNDQVKLIYIDPPYNTGNDFVYNDDFSDPKQHYLEVTGQVDAEGNRLVANTEVSGRKHSNWLTMMYPRLSLARNLLTQDGSIFVSIDDNEVSNLRSLLDEIFGPENFVGQLVWAAGRKNDAKFISSSHEYVLVYARNLAFISAEIKQWRTRKTGLEAIYKMAEKLQKQFGNDYESATRALKDWFKTLPEGDDSKRHKHYSHLDARGVYFPDNISWPGGGGPSYDVLHPVTGQPVKKPNRGWLYTEDKLRSRIADDLVFFGPDHTSVPCDKRYLKDAETEVPYSVFYTDGRGATKRLRELLGGEYFDFPKDEQVLAKFIEFATQGSGIVMDFFAGSGTTGHSVMLQNAKDGGNRKYVLVTIDEPTDPKSFARAQGIEGVSEITLARLKAVHAQFSGSGFRALKLAKSSFETNIVPDGQLAFAAATSSHEFSEEAMASEILLKLGVRIDEAVQPITGRAYTALLAGDVLVATSKNVDLTLIEEAQKAKCNVLAALEDAFAGNDDLKANLYFACKKANITFKTF
jgi:adenine-specific DNA-methyltransferase